MQITLKNRETINGVVTIKSVPVDTSNFPMMTSELVVYAISGTGPSLTIQYEPSNDLETWSNMGASFMLNAAGNSLVAFTAQAGFYQRYVRASIALAGTGPLASYSLWANLYPGT